MGLINHGGVHPPGGGFGLSVARPRGGFLNNDLENLTWGRPFHLGGGLGWSVGFTGGVIIMKPGVTKVAAAEVR